MIGARRRGPLAGDERGAVTAEFAVALPAVVLVIAFALTALSAGGRQVQLEHAAAQSARLAARGEDAARVHAVAEAIAGPVGVERGGDGDLVCITVSASARAPLPTLRARSCALSDGIGAG